MQMGLYKTMMIHNWKLIDIALTKQLLATKLLTRAAERASRN